MIYTSNYARKGHDKNSFAVSVGLKERNQHLIQLKTVAPTWEIVNAYKDGSIDRFLYTKAYIELLEARNFDAHKFIEQFPDDEDYFLLCYEAPWEFCHRRLLAIYIEDVTGIEIPKWKTEKELAIERQQQAVDDLLDF